MNFDPITGQPINKNFDPNTGQPINVSPQQTQTVNQNINQNENNQIQQVNVNQNAMIQQNPQAELQYIPNVEQDKQAFINNAQAINTEKTEEKKEGVNFVFITIVFLILIACILFLFPILIDYI